MINSYGKQIGTLSVPYYNGEVSMLPFLLEDLSTLPLEFLDVVSKMIKDLPTKFGQSFLTVHGKFVKANNTLRRGAPHTDGNYIKEASAWENGGWKVGGDGRTLSLENHKKSYETKTGGMLIVSNYSACKGWNGTFKGKPNVGGDCSHIKLDNGFMLDANKVYYGNSQFIHESLPVKEDIHRVMFRITLPLDYPILN